MALFLILSSQINPITREYLPLTILNTTHEKYFDLLICYLKLL